MLRTRPCSASAIAMVSTISTRPMPRPYARNTARPDTKFSCSKVVVTAMRKVGMVHDNDTNAYDTPNRKVDHNSRPSRSPRLLRDGKVDRAPHEEPDAEHDEPETQQQRHPGQPLLDRVEAPLQHDADQSEDDEEAHGHRDTHGERSEHARPLVRMFGALEAEEVRQVRRQHGEATRVEGRDHADPERVGERRVDHASRSSRMICSRSDCESRPVCTFAIVPSAFTNNVVGMLSRSMLLAIWPCLSNSTS